MIDKIGFKLWWWEQQAKEELEKIKSDPRKIYIPKKKCEENE